jgi:hypothetical protein
MRYHEISAGWKIPINAEEAALLRHIGAKTVAKNTLDARQQVLARRMTSRGLLDHLCKHDETCYRVSSVNDIWRDQYDGY